MFTTGPSRSPSLGALSSPGTHSSPPSRCEDTPEVNGGMPTIKKPLSTPLSMSSSKWFKSNIKMVFYVLSWLKGNQYEINTLKVHSQM